MSERIFDVVVWGATGFTGSLVAEYLSQRAKADPSFRFAIAGRNAEKLRAVKEQLGASDLEVLLGDSMDSESLKAIAVKTKVVLTTVGPYAKYGSPLVEACVESGTDYCDLTGEVPWIRTMIDRHHDRAQQTGARVVHCCGFDSVPMDIGTWFIQREAQKHFGAYCREIAMLVRAAKGGISGGTALTLLNLLEATRQNPELNRLLTNPYALNPKSERPARATDERDQQSAHYYDDAQSWTAPFVMAPINTRIVRRSHALLGFPWGDEFTYREALMTGDGLAGRLKALAISGGLGALVATGRTSLGRHALARLVFPRSGEGPNEQTQSAGFFKLRFFGELADGHKLSGQVSGDGDPGYSSTSKMIGECALCLAQDDIKTPGGILTPAAAMAEPLIERLQRHAGLAFSLVD